MRRHLLRLLYSEEHTELYCLPRPADVESFVEQLVNKTNKDLPLDFLGYEIEAVDEDTYNRVGEETI